MERFTSILHLQDFAKGENMTQSETLSKKKLLEFLREFHTNTKGIDNNTRYLYSTGRNQVLDTLAVGIMAGDFDAEPDSVKEETLADRLHRMVKCPYSAKTCCKWRDSFGMCRNPDMPGLIRCTPETCGKYEAGASP